MKSGFRHLAGIVLAGSTFLLTGGSAFAADAFEPEPETIAYVEACDVYGAGFFHLPSVNPGPGICIKTAGEVSVEYSSVHYHDGDEDPENHEAKASAQFGLLAVNETEYGTLRSNILLETEVGLSQVHEQETALVVATIDLAGFRAGYDGDDGSAWSRYAGEGYYEANSDGLYNSHNSMFMEYGGVAGSVDYVFGLHDSDVSGTPGAPDAYGALRWSLGGMTLGGAILHDQNGGTNGQGGGRGAFAWRIRGDIELENGAHGLGFGAWYENDGGNTDYVKGHTWGVTAKAGLGENLLFYAGYSEYDGLKAADQLDAANWTGGGLWEVAEGLELQAEYSATWYGNQAAADNRNSGTFSFGITRSF